MPEYKAIVTPQNPWETCSATIRTKTPAAPTITMDNVKLEVKPDPQDFPVDRKTYPNGLIVVKEEKKPELIENSAEFPIIITNERRIMLPLNGWPRGGGVIFL
ncbi:MAG: hypothetical protein KAJ51_11110 [Thermoplasmata archaeon]|nr:hypothetical protein [Thermoplasmata archaeon]